jgi:organic radical activating enzyme
MLINEIFESIQGEGYSIGKPALFIRVAGCNMKPKCKFCDSVYSWNNKEKYKEYSVEQLVEEIKKYKCKRIIWTGGEPGQYYDEIQEVKDGLDWKYVHEIETNGLVFCPFFAVINVSPKKQNYNCRMLREYLIWGPMHGKIVTFKFVYEKDSIEWIQKVIKDVNIPPNLVYIMPEGRTRREQLKLSPEVIEFCRKNDYNFSPRLHILIWNRKRRV